jgi:hypothetical protein
VVEEKVSRQKSGQGAQNLMGENLKLVRDEFSTISKAVLMMCIYLSMLMHANIYTGKLGPGLVLLARIRPLSGVSIYDINAKFINHSNQFL